MIFRSVEVGIRNLGMNLRPCASRVSFSELITVSELRVLLSDV